MAWGGVVNPVTKTPQAIQSFETWDGNYRGVGKSVFSLLDDGNGIKIAVQPAHNVFWHMPAQTYDLFAVASQEVMPGAQLGVIYVLQCQQDYYLLYNKPGKEIGVEVVPQGGTKMTPIP